MRLKHFREICQGSLQQVFAGNVAGTITGLTQVEVLFEYEQLLFRSHPAARCARHVHGASFLHGHFVGMCIQRSETARGSLCLSS